MPRLASFELRQKKGEEVKELELAEVEPTLEYVVTYFRQVGPTMSGKEVTFGELNAFCERTGVNLDEFESMAIKHMSAAYIGMSHQGRDPACPCPAIDVPDFDELDGDDLAAKRAEVSKQLGSWLGSVEESQKQRGMTKRK